jgi:hypothetical protein
VKTLAEGCSGVRARRIPMRKVLRRRAGAPHSSSTRYSLRCTSIWEGGAGGGRGWGKRKEGIHVSQERLWPLWHVVGGSAECALEDSLVGGRRSAAGRRGRKKSRPNMRASRTRTHLFCPLSQ